MSIKKIVTMLIAGVTAVSGVLISATGCDSSCKHPDVQYTVITPATCADEGLASGNCPDCGETVTKVLPKDPDNHVYGEWQVNKPTESEKGSATISCVHDGSTESVELPAITADDEGYTTQITVAPKALHEGEKQYTYANDIKDVVFTMPVPARGVKTVADGFEAAMETSDLVRSGEGVFGWMRYNMFDQIDGDEAGGKYTNVNYEYGDNYTYSYEDGGNVYKWCSVDENGDLFAFTRTGENGEVTRENDEGFLDGPTVNLTGVMLQGNGARGFLRDLYELAQLNSNQDYEENYNEQTGEYFFKFGYVSRATEQMQTFAKIEVTFTLNDDYSLNTFDVVSNGYVNIPSLEEDRKPIDPATGERVEVETWEWKYDANDNAIATLIVPEYHGHRMYETVHIEQKSVKQAEEEGLPVPVMPEEYRKELIMISDFNLYRGGQLLTEDGEPISATANSPFTVRLGDVVPSTVNYRFENVNVYLVDEDGSEHLIGADTINTLYYSANFNPETQNVTLTSRIAGDVTLKIASTYTSKKIVVHTNAVLPTRLLPSVREYDEGTYVWRNSTTTTIQSQVYVGQPLWFRVSPPEDELLFAEKGFTTRFLDSNNQEYTPETAEVTDDTVNDEQVKKFVATAPGVYRIQFRSTAGMRGGTITITVAEIPDVTEQLTGRYSAVVTYPQSGRVTVEFTLNGSGKGSALVTRSSGDRERLDFEYTQTATGLTLTSRHAGFADFGYSLSFNEAWQLVLSCPTGYGDEIETVVLIRSAAE